MSDAGTVTVTDLTAFLVSTPPFDSLSCEVVATLEGAATVRTYAPGDLVLDAFSGPTVEVFVVLTGRVDLWNDVDRSVRDPDESVGPGGIFGFSAMLSERSIGPRAVAAELSTIALIPSSVASSAFATRSGARFLARRMFAADRAQRPLPSYNVIDDLVAASPLVVEPGTPAAEVARLMTSHETGYAVIDLGSRRFGLVTDASLRERVVAQGVSGTAPARQVMADPIPTAVLGDSAAEALIRMLEVDADHIVVLDAEERLRGVVSMRDFTLSPTTADMSLNERLRRAATVDELAEQAKGVPVLLDDLLSRGLASGKVIAVHSTIVDAVIRRAVALVFAAHDGPAADGFTWLSLGSNGRREAVLSSDVDSAVAFTGSPPEELIGTYLGRFAEVHGVLVRAGMVADSHGATAQRRAFARTQGEWQAASQQWLAHPEENQGAMMTSLLVDGRPILGPPGLPMSGVFKNLRNHPGTMRMLLEESLARRAKRRSTRDLLTRQPARFDIKRHALLPIVNIGRWSALSVGSSALSTVQRLQAAAGSTMLPAEQATILVEVFQVLQRLRLRYQLMEYQDGQRPSDRLAFDRMSPIDRSVIAQAVHEIAAAQRRMTNVSVYLSADQWTEPVIP